MLTNGNQMQQYDQYGLPLINGVVKKNNNVGYNYNFNTQNSTASSEPEKAKTIDITVDPLKKDDGESGVGEIFDGLGTIGLMNTRTEQVWLDSERKIKGIDQSLNYAYATMQMARSVSNQQGLDLKTWLWNALWFSSSLFKAPSKSKSYKQSWKYG